MSGSCVHGILKARILEWVAIPFSMGSSTPKDRTWVLGIADGFFTIWAAWEAHGYPLTSPTAGAKPLHPISNQQQVKREVQPWKHPDKSSLSHISVQFSSVAQSYWNLCDPMDCSTPGLPVHHQLLEFTQTQVHWVGDAIQPSHPLLSPSPPALNLSQHQGLFKWVSPSHQVANVLEFQLQHQSSQYSRLISFRMDLLYLLAVQGTLKSLLQHHSSKASVLWGSTFFVVPLSHPYITTGKAIALTRQNFVDKVMSLLFNMLSRLVITFLPRSKRLLISWLQSPSAVILEPPKNKVSCLLIPNYNKLGTSLKSPTDW